MISILKKGFQICFIVFLVGVFAGPVSAKGRMIQIKGSDTMVNLAQAWAEEFMRENPESVIAVTGGGSGTGIASIISGTCDIAQASRQMKEKEIARVETSGSAVKETVVGYDGIAIVVHPNNPISELTMDQLSDVFMGKITHWSQLGGDDLEILVLSRDRNSGTHVFFLEHVLRRGDSKRPEEFSNQALMMPSNQSLVQEVKTSEAAIGYVGLGYVSKDQKTLRVAKNENEEGILPTLESVKNGSYPISRPLYFYTQGETEEDVEKYIEFVLGPVGQDIIEMLDFVPIK